MHKWLFNREELKTLIGFEPTVFHAAIVFMLAVFDLLNGSGEMYRAFPPAAVIATVAGVGLVASAAGSVMASNAASDASKKTPEEEDLTNYAESIQTGVDRASVEGAVDQAATPIAGAIAAGQQQVSEDMLAAEGGGGAPSAFSGRGAALKRQLAQEGGSAISQAALGAQQTAEQKALIREEQKGALFSDAAGLARQRKAQALQGQLSSAGMIGGMGGSIMGGAASGLASGAMAKA